MKLSGWGNYPQIESTQYNFSSEEQLCQIVEEHQSMAAFGNGRSYGDSALAKNSIVMKNHNYFLQFDERNGVLEVEAGVLLAEIIEAFAPRGWFPKVVPGTKLITVGGAIASDVHGKNHHVSGCFSESVISFQLLLADGSIVECSRDENKPLFLASCGGMGLTGVILRAKLKLKKIKSNAIVQTTIKTENLKETFEAFERYKSQPYSVAWIDCLAKGSSIGRCLLNFGDFAQDQKFDFVQKKKLNIPFNFPSFALNNLSVKAFNWLYYHKVLNKKSTKKVSIDSFFFPLDAIDNWNRIYGKNGFTQYQFILPLAESYKGLEEVLSAIAESGKGSFLAVLKLYGKENDNLLSFPMEGYSLALDFKMEPGLMPLLEKLDQIVIKYGGRIYLAKDSRMSQSTFESGYPKAEEFRALRKSYKLTDKFSTLQSQRLGI
ncbi:FAD-binding oxidoreductase [Aliikangiella sp. G2MR2-5]|uniref:FAD-binding oxidoreductase n=1 Tax=Aliikangiella sp. G2MR2-5 TaxID=2788943 RepID=UPI0018A8911A|nr:FAD-binding oxidoreductase [Aliikangiella sp. G2MR2-5]